MKVLSLVWDLIRGGSEGQCARTAMGLCETGAEHRVGVFRKQGFFLEAVEAACGPVYDVGIQRMFRLHTRQCILALADFIRAEQFDLVHAWDCDAVIFGSMAAKRAGVPFLSSRRDLGTIYPPHKKWLMRRADRGAAGVVVNAQSIARLAEADGIPRERIHVIPNILDLEEFDRLANEAPACAAAELILVARLDPEKDVATLLRAMPQIRDEANVLVVGDGACRPELEAQVRALGLQARVRFAGMQDAVAPLLRQAQIGLLVPKANEGLSNTLLEYLAAGLPVVATDCGGNAELVAEGENGYLVAIGDAEALAERVNRLLADPEQASRFGAAGRKRVEQGHAPSEIVGRFADLYKELCRS